MKIKEHLICTGKAYHYLLFYEWLGHSNLETTLIYAYADIEMKRVAIEKATAANHCS